eukprot:COSAG01_NODE_1846_length_9050_cov_10.563991_10_plen_266_part_00
MGGAAVLLGAVCASAVWSRNAVPARHPCRGTMSFDSDPVSPKPDSKTLTFENPVGDEPIKFQNPEFEDNYEHYDDGMGHDITAIVHKLSFLPEFDDLNEHKRECHDAPCLPPLEPRRLILRPLGAGARVVKALRTDIRTYKAGDFIVKQGQNGDTFFVVALGEVTIAAGTIDGSNELADETEKELGLITFGHNALSSQSAKCARRSQGPRDRLFPCLLPHAPLSGRLVTRCDWSDGGTVKAVTDVECLTIDRATCKSTRLLTPMA